MPARPAAPPRARPRPPSPALSDGDNSEIEGDYDPEVCLLEDERRRADYAQGCLDDLEAASQDEVVAQDDGDPSSQEGATWAGRPAPLCADYLLPASSSRRAKRHALASFRTDLMSYHTATATTVTAALDDGELAHDLGAMPVLPTLFARTAKRSKGSGGAIHDGVKRRRVAPSTSTAAGGARRAGAQPRAAPPAGPRVGPEILVLSDSDDDDEPDDEPSDDDTDSTGSDASTQACLEDGDARAAQGEFDVLADAGAFAGGGDGYERYYGPDGAVVQRKIASSSTSLAMTSGGAGAGAHLPSSSSSRASTAASSSRPSRRTLRTSGGVVASSTSFHATSRGRCLSEFLVNSSVVVLPDLRDGTASRRWAAALAARYGSTSRILFRVVGDKYDVLGKALGHRTNEHTRWKLLGRGTGAVAYSQGRASVAPSGVTVWRINLYVDAVGLRARGQGEVKQLVAALEGAGMVHGFERRRSRPTKSTREQCDKWAQRVQARGSDGEKAAVAALDDEAAAASLVKLPSTTTSYYQLVNKLTWQASTRPLGEVQASALDLGNGDSLSARFIITTSRSQLDGVVSGWRDGQIAPEDVARTRLAFPHGFLSLHRALGHRTFPAQATIVANILCARTSPSSHTAYYALDLGLSTNFRELYISQVPLAERSALLQHAASAILFPFVRIRAAWSLEAGSIPKEATSGGGRASGRTGASSVETRAQERAAARARGVESEKEKFVRDLAALHSNDGLQVPFVLAPMVGRPTTRTYQFTLPSSRLLLSPVLSDPAEHGRRSRLTIEYAREPTQGSSWSKMLKFIEDNGVTKVSLRRQADGIYVRFAPSVNWHFAAKFAARVGSNGGAVRASLNFYHLDLYRLELEGLVKPRWTSAPMSRQEWASQHERYLDVFAVGGPIAGDEGEAFIKAELAREGEKMLDRGIPVLVVTSTQVGTLRIPFYLFPTKYDAGKNVHHYMTGITMQKLGIALDETRSTYLYRARRSGDGLVRLYSEEWFYEGTVRTPRVQSAPAVGVPLAHFVTVPQLRQVEALIDRLEPARERARRA